MKLGKKGWRVPAGRDRAGWGWLTPHNETQGGRTLSQALTTVRSERQPAGVPSGHFSSSPHGPGHSGARLARHLRTGTAPQNWRMLIDRPSAPPLPPLEPPQAQLFRTLLLLCGMASGGLPPTAAGAAAPQARLAGGGPPAGACCCAPPRVAAEAASLPLGGAVGAACGLEMLSWRESMMWDTQEMALATTM